VRAALLTESGHPTRWTWPGGLLAEDLLAAVHRQRVAALVASRLDVLGMPTEVADALTSARDRERPQVLVQAAEMRRVGRLLEEADVPFLVFKGLALAVQTTGDLSARGAGDLDLLIAPASAERAYRALTDAGWVTRPDYPTDPRSWAWRHLVSTYYGLTMDGDNSTVDLHWRLDPTWHAFPPFEVLWARRQEVVVAGPPVNTLSFADALVHSCHHAAKDEWRWLRSLVDVHRLARDPEAWRGAATQVGPLEVSTLAVVADLVGLPDAVPSAVLRRVGHVPSRVPRRAVATQDRPVGIATPPGRETVREVRRRLRSSRHPGDVARTFQCAVLPFTTVNRLDEPRALPAILRGLVLRCREVLRRILGAPHSPESGALS